MVASIGEVNCVEDQGFADAIPSTSFVNIPGDLNCYATDRNRWEQREINEVWTAANEVLRDDRASPFGRLASEAEGVQTLQLAIRGTMRKLQRKLQVSTGNIQCDLIELERSAFVIARKISRFFKF